MANTRQSAKRARQSKDRQARNQVQKSIARTSIKAVLNALDKKDTEKTREAYFGAVRTLSKVASKGVIPKNRAARKISRLTALLRNTLPEALTPGAKKASKQPAKKAASKEA